MRCSLISYLHPARNAALLEQLAGRRVTAVAMDAIPRTISRAQTFDSLSSQANIAGYRRVARPESLRCVNSGARALRGALLLPHGAPGGGEGRTVG